MLHEPDIQQEIAATLEWRNKTQNAKSLKYTRGVGGESERARERARARESASKQEREQAREKEKNERESRYQRKNRAEQKPPLLREEVSPESVAPCSASLTLLHS